MSDNKYVNNNNVLQLLRSNKEVATVEDAVKLLDNFHNHQYGQQIVVKYRDEQGHGGLVVAIGVSYPDEYVIIFKGDLGNLPKEIELDNIESKTEWSSDMPGNFEWRVSDDVKYLKFLWDVYYNKADDDNTKGNIVFNDNIVFNNLHRADSTPVQNEVYVTNGNGWDGNEIQMYSIDNPYKIYPLPKDVLTDEAEERGGNVWATENEDWKVLCYRYQNDGEDCELSYLNMSDFIVDSVGKDVSLKYKNENGKWWWEICTQENINNYINKPESVAPSLRSIQAMYEKLSIMIEENTKLINKVHAALHDYADWDSKRNNVEAYLNDGVYKTDAPEWIDQDEQDLKLIENNMCLYLYYNNEAMNWFIDDNGNLVEEELDNGKWNCPIDE